MKTETKFIYALQKESKPHKKNTHERGNMERRNTWALRTLIVANVVFVLLAWAGLAGAQSFPRLKPLPPKKEATALAATPALAPDSPWQLLTNQPPVLDYTDCGPGNPLLLTDGTVMLADNGCQDWWDSPPTSSAVT